MREQRFPLAVVPAHCVDALPEDEDSRVRGASRTAGVSTVVFAGRVVTEISVTGWISHGDPRQIFSLPEPADSSACKAS